MDKINKISPGLMNADGGLAAAITGRNTDFDGSDVEEMDVDEKTR